MGGMVLASGPIAEMKTGEGKTFVAPLAAYLNGLDRPGRPRRHRQRLPRQARRAVDRPGVLAPGHERRLHPARRRLPRSTRTSPRPMSGSATCARSPRREAYAADVTYGTNNEFGFDYLRDNLVVDLEQPVQRGHFFAIVDEVDNILIDEARTPLIISRPGGGIGRQVRPASPQLVPRPEGGGGLRRRREVPPGGDHRGRDRQDGEVAGRREHLRRRLPLARHLEQALKAAGRSTSGTATTSSRTARWSSSTSSPAG